MAMELLKVSDAAMAKYFTMMLDGTARSWLKGLPPKEDSTRLLEDLYKTLMEDFIE